MTYEQTVTLIETIAKQVNPNGVFSHGRRLDATLDYDKQMPQIHLYPWITTPDLTNGFDGSNIVMGFWTAGGQELSPEQNKEKISEADTMARAFLHALKETEAIDVTGIRMEPGYNLFIAQLTGYTVTFTLTSKTSTCS